MIDAPGFAKMFGRTRVVGAENLRPEGFPTLFFEAFFRLLLFFKNGRGIILQDGFQLKQHYGTKQNTTHKEEIFMQTVRKMRKRSGFTLVELLIVIIIIGILAGAMMLLAGSGTDSAEATKIISDLRSMKAAALMYYADNPSAPMNIAAATTNVDSLDKYSDMEIKSDKFAFVGDANHWFVGRKNLAGTGVIAKLEDTKDIVLYSSIEDAAVVPTESADHTGAKWIYMIAR